MEPLGTSLRAPKSCHLPMFNFVLHPVYSLTLNNLSFNSIIRYCLFFFNFFQYYSLYQGKEIRKKFWNVTKNFSHRYWFIFPRHLSFLWKYHIHDTLSLRNVKTIKLSSYLSNIRSSRKILVGTKYVRCSCVSTVFCTRRMYFKISKSFDSLERFSRV